MPTGLLKALSTLLSALIVVVRDPLRPERFACSQGYRARIAANPINVFVSTPLNSNTTVERGSFWLLSNNDDFYTIQMIKQTACLNQEIPVIVISMHPSQGIEMEIGSDQYMQGREIATWEQYDKRLKEYAEELGDVPSIIIMEPALLMRTFQPETEHSNTEFQMAFIARVANAVDLFYKSWIYVDAGNAMYLQWTVNLKHIISTLKKMPANIRGFSINVASFVNTSYSQRIAEEIHCQTGLHYIIDTSRNGGDFSTRSLDEIEECSLDPPYVEKGTRPTWKEGAVAANSRVRKRRGQFDNSEPIYGSGGGIPLAGGTDSGEGENIGDYNSNSDYYYYGSSIRCVTAEGDIGLDAFVWAKNPGESDGRLFLSGSFHQCLMGHEIECSQACPKFLLKVRGRLIRNEFCKCIDE